MFLTLIMIDIFMIQDHKIEISFIIKGLHEKPFH